MYDVVFYEAFEEEEKALRKFLPQGKQYLFTWKTIQESGHKTPQSKVISVRTQSKFPLEWASLLEGIITRSTGYDHVTAYLEATGAKLKAAYLPDYAARAVAEQAMLLWSACLRRLKVQQECFGSFHRDGLTGREIKGRSIAVAGVGRIGSQIVDIARGLGMKPIGIDIKPKPGLKLDYMSFEKAFPIADVIVCALPLTHETKGLLGRKTLSKAKRGSIFINIARGEISPSEDLLEMLEDGQLSGVGLDVYDHEKEVAAILRDDSSIESVPDEARKGVEAVLKLMRHPQAILTPHNAFNTEESVERKSQHTALNLELYFSKGDFLTPLDTVQAK